MLQSRVRKACLSAALSVAALLGTAGSAQAAIYTGTWDPAYGAPFGDLGWKGSATFLLPDSCVGLTGSFSNNPANPPSCGNGGMQVLSATVEFYNSSTDPSGSAVLQTLVFDPSPLVVVDGMSIAGGLLAGVDTGFFNGVKGTIDIAQYLGQDFYFHLVFHADQAQLFYTKDASITPACASGGFGGPVLGVCGYAAEAAHVVFAPVPEPATYAMVLAGLAAVGFTARRRRR